MDKNRIQELYRIRPISEVSQIPKTPHYAVLINKSQTIYHEGDERSRTNPGHGYPAYSETINSIEYYDFLTHAEVVEYINYVTTNEFTPVKLSNIRVQHIENTVTPEAKVDIIF